MSARLALRTATAEAHERVDRLFSELRLGQFDHYRLFLTAQAAAHIPVEQALDNAAAGRVVPDWPSRRRAALLEGDLAALGAIEPELLPPPVITSSEEILGAVYVLEGSRLGGAYLKRAVRADAPRAFLDAPQPAGAWRRLGLLIDDALADARALEGAVEKAREVFDLFYRSGERHLARSAVP